MERNRKNYIIISGISLVFILLSTIIKNRFIFDGLLAFFIYFTVASLLKRSSWVMVGIISFLLTTAISLYISFSYFPQRSALIQLYMIIKMFVNDVAITGISMTIYSAVITFCGQLDIYMSKRTNRKKSAIASLIVGLTLMILSYFALTNQITTVYYDLTIPNLPNELDGLKIVHISDTHSTIYPEGNNLAELIRRQQPDLILHTGDMADDVTEYAGTKMLLEGIKDIAPIYYVTGNHEYWAKDFWETNSKIKTNVIALENESRVISIKGQELIIAGINDPDEASKTGNAMTSEEKLMQMEKDFDGVKILMSHRSELVDEYSQFEYDLVLSGHAHGGQIRIPFILNGLFAPNQGFFPKYAGGYYELDSKNPNKTSFIVSRGLAIQNSPRVFNPPELVVITLRL